MSCLAINNKQHANSMPINSLWKTINFLVKISLAKGTKLIKLAQLSYSILFIELASFAFRLSSYLQESGDWKTSIEKEYA